MSDPTFQPNRHALAIVSVKLSKIFAANEWVWGNREYPFYTPNAADVGLALADLVNLVGPDEGNAAANGRLVVTRTSDGGVDIAVTVGTLNGTGGLE